MAEEKEKCRRSNFLTDRIQIKYALMLCGVMALMLVLTQVYTMLSLRSILRHVVSSEYSHKITELQFHLLISGIAYIAAVAVLSFYVTNKIAGPVYRIQLGARKIAKSRDLNYRFHIRKKDEFQDVVKTLNLMLDKLQENHEPRSGGGDEGAPNPSG